MRDVPHSLHPHRRRRLMFRRGPSLLTIIYIVIGVFVASDHHYFENLSKIEQILSAVLAVLLWPLILLDVNLHIKG